ncbi:hypothetical protein vBBceHLY2_00111 [Bacillus phage vB_BceH_LY2]|nr:hypothetical protein vBBceHLY2_00111 [Bacillus phage vB_BceH_LY2]
MSKIIIELVDGTMLENDPSLPPNLDTPYEIREALAYDGGYWLSRGNAGQVDITYSKVKDVYVVGDKTTVVGDGAKYVKLQHVQELLKLMDKRDSYYDWSDEFWEYHQKVKNTIEFVERNAKTKEEL